MTLMPDVPVVIVVIHIVAFILLLTHTLIEVRQRDRLLREIRAVECQLLEAEATGQVVKPLVPELSS